MLGDHCQQHARGSVRPRPALFPVAQGCRRETELGGELRLAETHLCPDLAHVNLGLALKNKCDLDGAVAEYREALRLDPNIARAHNNLGVVLEQNGDRQGALGEYRAAYMLDPKNADYKQNYERLLQQVNK